MSWRNSGSTRSLGLVTRQRWIGNLAMLLEKGDTVGVDGRKAEVIERTTDGLLVVDGLMPDGQTRFQRKVRPTDVEWVKRDGKLISRVFW